MPFLRLLLSADRLSDLAILSALPDLKILDSRSSALLLCVTRADHFLAGFPVDFFLDEMDVAIKFVVMFNSLCVVSCQDSFNAVSTLTDSATSYKCASTFAIFIIGFICDSASGFFIIDSKSSRLRHCA